MKGFYVVVFVLVEGNLILKEKIVDDVIGLFVLMIFNLMLGFLFYMLCVNIILINMLVEEVVKLIIFFGMVILDKLFEIV